MSAGAGSEPQRTSFATSDPEEVRDFLGRAYGGRLRLGGFDDVGDLLRFDQVTLPDASVARAWLSGDLEFEILGQDEVLITTVLAGRIGQDDFQAVHRHGRGDICLSNHPGTHRMDQTHDVDMQVVALPVGLLGEVAGTERGFLHSGGFSSLLPVGGGARRWRTTMRFIEQALAQVGPGGSPLLLGPLARLMAATALTVFPNSVLPEAVPGDRRDAHPVTLRRAVAYIEANPDLDISLGDIARAACASPRAVQLAFRRHLDTTPMAYLRQVRLAQAHLELSASDPRDGVTVTEIATRWGFTSARFAVRYRHTYGQTPSHTLHHGSP